MYEAISTISESLPGLLPDQPLRASTGPVNDCIEVINELAYIARGIEKGRLDGLKTNPNVRRRDF